MSTVKELYDYLSAAIPASLSCEWDNDGLMCCPDAGRELRSALVTLDITDAAADRALEVGADVIISHHPLIFRPLWSVTEDGSVSRRVIRLIGAGVCAMSFHTRLDAVCGGVNDALAAALGCFVSLDSLPGAAGEPPVGRVGTLAAPVPLESFAQTVKTAIGCGCVSFCGEGEVMRVAICGGDGKDFISNAAAAGADTYLSGQLSYNSMLDAAQEGLNTVEAGHFHTENPVCDRLCELVREFSPQTVLHRFESNMVNVI